MLFNVMVYHFLFPESSGGYTSTPNAFLFSLRNEEGLAPFKSIVKRPSYAIHRHSSIGPLFGIGHCNDIDVIVLFTSGPHLRHNYHGNKTLETMLSGFVEFVGHRLNRPVLLHLCVSLFFL